MAENLRVARLRDGTPIPTVNNEYAVWQTLSTPAMALNTVSACGAYYNWYAAGTEQLCPAGWRLPTTREWFELVNSIEEHPPFHLMEASSVYWVSPNSFSTNETGFSALGCDNKMISHFWTSTSSSTNPSRANRALIDIYGFGMKYDSYPKWDRSCIRCIRD